MIMHPMYAPTPVYEVSSVCIPCNATQLTPCHAMPCGVMHSLCIMKDRDRMTQKKRRKKLCTLLSRGKESLYKNVAPRPFYSWQILISQDPIYKSPSLLQKESIQLTYNKPRVGDRELTAIYCPASFF